MTGDAPAAGAQASVEEAGVNRVSMLMPVWGYRFVGRFLEFCLPTLLAPNNIPALARELPCRLILLSSENDVALIKSHPTWQKLAQVCTAEIQLIDDLITESNHTATITLAFERALRQAPGGMRNTCFFFLMSDYIVADGSLLSALATIRSGARGVFVGNFQVTAEDAAPLLRSIAGPGSSEIVLKPRDLLQWSLGHLHSATVANIVNIGLTHNAHTNRLFWRVDENTLIGRFYLMHAIAIHPEVEDFVVGSSWDYSFIPELCPSGRVATLTDSDDYLVVELQSRGYESDNLRPGPITAAELAIGLSEWATERHRNNVEQVLVFHAADKPPALTAVIAQSNAFINAVRDVLSAPALPHRNHPYWVGSAAVNRFRSNRPLNGQDWKYLLSDPGISPPSQTKFAELRVRLFGHRPDLTRLHPSWPDYVLVNKAIHDTLSAGGKILLVSGDPKAFARWAAHAIGDIFTLGFDQLLVPSRHAYTSLLDTLDCCLIVIDELQLELLDLLLGRALPLIRPNGKIHVLAINPGSTETAIQFSRSFTREAARVLQQGVGAVDVYYVPSTRYRWSLRTRLSALLASTENASFVRLPFIFAAALATAFALFLANQRTKAIRGSPPVGIWSSVFLTVRRAKGTKPPLPRFRDSRIAGLDASLVAQTAPELSREEFGPEFRASSNDPNQLASSFARYRLVSTIFDGRHEVAEFGCENLPGARLVLQRIRHFAIYDSRDDVVSRLEPLNDDERCEVRAHDILASPLPKRYDSIFSIDYIKYLSHDDEGQFLRNLRDSLGREFDFLLIGTPCHVGLPGAIVPQAAATDSLRNEGRGNRIYRRTPEELHALMQYYFHSVFMFSMIQDQVHSGISRGAEFAFALGCGK